MRSEEVPSSFRDPSGFLFRREGSLYRQINKCYKNDYEFLCQSGLYRDLVDQSFLIPHREVDVHPSREREAYKIIKPEPLSFVSYPYEWCFSQLKDAALTTLKIQKKAFEFKMSLKDCSAYNIQFRNGKPIFIDSLSFEQYRKGEPWVAYRQFCQHFLAPLALMSYTDVRLNRLLQLYLDGIPLDLASKLLPFKSKLSPSLMLHIHIHAMSQKKFSSKGYKRGKHKMGRLAFQGLVDGLESAIKKLNWNPKGSEWGGYYKDTNYSSDAMNHKKQLVGEFLDRGDSKIVWDLGANDGTFSRIASARNKQVISFDIDPIAVEKNYSKCVEEGETNILPLLLDLTNPSSAIGWENKERMSTGERATADTAFALALLHHLAISGNLPFHKIADYFHTVCKSLIIEFVPKDDSQVRRLLSTREDIFVSYTQDSFEREFQGRFKIKEKQQIKDSRRTLYLMDRK